MIKLFLVTLLISITAQAAFVENVVDGVRFRSSSETSVCPDGRVIRSSSTLKQCVSNAWLALVNESTTNTLTNKSIDADNNTITNIDNNEIKAAAGIAYSKLNLSSSIVNADVSGSAAIAYSKLNLSSSIVNADVSGSAAIAYSKLNLSSSIVNADVSGSAAIAHSKMAALTASRAMVTDGSGVASASSVTATELGHVSGVTSAIQTQLDAKAPLAGATFTGTVNLSATNELRLQDTTGGEYVGFKAPGTVSASYTLTMPAATGANGEYLTTNGSGTLAWTTPVDSILPIGSIANLGMTLSAGVLTIHDGDGAALATNNPGKVVMSSTTAGQSVTLSITANATINDDSHASSDFTNYGWGITEANNWDSNRPFWLYVINRGNSNLDGADGSSMFAIALSPFKKTSPSSVNSIGDTGAIPSTDDQNGIIILADVTIANYTSLPMQLIGAVQMQWSAANADWTIQALAVNTSGIGPSQLDKVFQGEYTYPQVQHGAAASSHMQANGGTAPIFSTNTYNYYLSRNGWVTIRVFLNGDGGTDGSGAVDSYLTVPYATPSTAVACNVARLNKATSVEFATVENEASTNVVRFMGNDSVSVKHSEFGNGSRTVSFTCSYMPAI